MIKIKNLTKKFGKTPILDSINLTVKRGDRIALIGPNGAGKTTLIRTILGQYLFNGELAVFDKNPRHTGWRFWIESDMSPNSPLRFK